MTESLQLPTVTSFPTGHDRTYIISVLILSEMTEASPPIMSEPHIVRRVALDEGDIIDVLGVRQVKARGRDTGYAFGIYEMRLEPGQGVPLHAHPCAEFFYVLEGEVDIARVGDDGQVEWLRCVAGDSVNAPINAPHGFGNRSGALSCLPSTSTYHHEAIFQEGGRPANAGDPIHPVDQESVDLFGAAAASTKVFSSMRPTADAWCRAEDGAVRQSRLGLPSRKRLTIMNVRRFPSSNDTSARTSTTIARRGLLTDIGLAIVSACGLPSAGTATIRKRDMSSPDESPQMGLAFARTYEQTATRITAPISFAALERIGPIGPGTRILDVGAGTGALSIPAAHAGASVTAIDIAPGMVELLSERLTPFPHAVSLVMDGQAMSFADGAFDLAVSVVGVSLFQDWRRGLAEQVRVLRSGGRAALATWRTPPGGGPFLIMAQAMRAVFPDRAPPPAPEGFLVLSDPTRMDRAMRDAGLRDLKVEEVEAVWEGPAGRAYLEELRELHSFMPAYAALEAEEHARVNEAILAAVDKQAINGRIVLTTSIVLGTGTKT